MRDIDFDILHDILIDIRDELQEMNAKLTCIQGFGTDNSIADVCDKLDDIKGVGLYNSLTDVCDKLDAIDTSVSLIG